MPSPCISLTAHPYPHPQLCRDIKEELGKGWRFSKLKVSRSGFGWLSVLVQVPFASFPCSSPHHRLTDHCRLYFPGFLVNHLLVGPTSGRHWWEGKKGGEARVLGSTFVPLVASLEHVSLLWPLLSAYFQFCCVIQFLAQVIPPPSTVHFSTLPCSARCCKRGWPL